MNKQEHEQCQHAVKRFMEMEGIENLSAISDTERPPKPHPSWSWCDQCKQWECELLRCDCGRCYYMAKYLGDPDFPLFECPCGKRLFWD